MSRVKEHEIYPKFEFRLTPEGKAWLAKELGELKEKFSEPGYPAVTKNTLVMAALRHGLRHLRAHTKLKAK